MADPREEPHDRGSLNFISLAFHREMTGSFGHQHDGVAAEGPAGKGGQGAALLTGTKTRQSKVAKGECRMPVG